MLVAIRAICGVPDDTVRLLEKADSIKSSDRTEFSQIIATLDERLPRLTRNQADFLRYLKVWRAVIDGSDPAVATKLKDIINSVSDVTLQFRARSTLMNLEELSRDYESAYSELNRLVAQLPK